MPGATSLTGRWTGSYYQHNRPYPITADLVQTGEQLTGSMRDGETDSSSGLFEFSSEAGLPPGADEQIHAQLRAMFPDEPAAPIRYVTHLPPESALEGWVHAPNVSFLKVYQGTSSGGFQVGDKLVGHTVDGHSVHYSGRISPDGTEIEGRWWIDADPEIGSTRNEGSFTLRRSAAEGASSSDRAE